MKTKFIHFTPIGGFSLLTTWIGYALCGCLWSGVTLAQSPNLGIFEQHDDIDVVGHQGVVEYDASQQSYTITGGGENMWFGTDAFHFVWKRISGNASLAADIDWQGTGGNAHRKACLLIRQSLAPNSPYADAVIHGDGLTSLQFREAPGGLTHEVQANITKPRRLRIERQEGTVSLSFAREDGALEASGCAYRITFTDPVYIGLGVCSHNSNVVEKAVFSRVQLGQLASPPTDKSNLVSTLEIVPIGSKDRKAIYHTRELMEAPNWSRDGKELIFNSKGRIWKVPIRGGTPVQIDTGFANRCNNDHGISPDGSQLVISDQAKGGKSMIYVLPINGGVPKQITPAGPSYWHGWSPDGQTLAYCAERQSNFDIFTIPVDGGAEQRLTTAAGLDDGPDYSADGKFIYFNSDRTGMMHIWRMHADGSQQEQVTFDEYNNWFPHPSPDGKWIVFLSYDKNISGHPANKDVLLRIMPASAGPIQVLAKLFGGQGTLNVPSWSPDSRQIAFVSYHWSW